MRFGKSKSSRFNLLTTSMLATLALAAPAFAQEATPPPTQEAAPAQTQQAAEEEEIVVTGFRASLADALDRKRDSDLIMESVTAEDIGEFPDRNIAEALARLPGVQVDRVAQGNTIGGGQGQRVLIRGLSQNAVLLNSDIFVTGLELFTFGEGNDRNIDSLEGIPSDLLGGADVFKSPNASLLEGGMGGTVNFRTRGPFDFEGSTIAGNVRYGEQEASGEWKPLGSILVSHQFSPQFAMLASVAYDESSNRADILGGANRGVWAFSNRRDVATVPTDYYAPEYRYATDRTEDRERFATSLALGFRPSDALELGAEWFHTELDILVSEASMKLPFNVESNGLNASEPFEIDENGVLLSGTLIATSAESISYVKKTDVESDNFQIHGDWDDGGDWRAHFRGAYSTADMIGVNANNDVRYTRYAVPTQFEVGPDNCPGQSTFNPANPITSPTGFCGAPANPAAPSSYEFTYTNGELPSFELGASDLLTNPENGYFKSHWVFSDTSEVENWSIRADLEHDSHLFGAEHLTFTGGARLAERNVDYAFFRYLADYSVRGEPDGSTFGQTYTNEGYFQDGGIGFKICDVPIADRPAGLPPELALCTQRNQPIPTVGGSHSPPLITPFQTFLSSPDRVESITDFWANGHITGNAILVQDRGPMENGVAWIQALYPDTPFNARLDPEQSFGIEEKTTSGYLMADLGGDEDNYHINLGARIIHTELTANTNLARGTNPRFFGSDSWNGVLRDFDPVTNERTYTDILPSLNVVLDVTDEHKIRFSAGRVVSRANLFLLGRSLHVDFTRDNTTGQFRAVSGSAGNPDLDPFRAWQQDITWEYYFGSQGLVSAAAFWKQIDSFVAVENRPELVNDDFGGTVVGIQRPVNGQGGIIRGFELVGQYAFDNGFGFTANYTYSESESPFFNDFDAGLPIPSVAKNAYNFQVYYENYGFEARLSYAWRDKSFQQNFGFADGVDEDGDGVTRTLGVWNREYGQLDAQIGYQFNENFGVTVEAINLTEEDMSQYLQFENLPFTFGSGSRTILIGGNFKFGY